jgi:pyruvate kinase
MVARGDLGVEIPTMMVPIYQKHIIRQANIAGKCVITATHMLDSMTHNPRCTRAEAADVCNAVLDGSDGVMLSAETAAGDYPVEACETMSQIAEEAEKILPYRERLDWLRTTSHKTIQDAVSIAISDATLTLDNIGAIVVFTQGGTTARTISKYRPQVPVLAVTFTKETQRRLESYWGVIPIYSDVVNKMTNDDDLASLFAKDYGIKKGMNIIISAGYPTGEGSANMMKIVEVK